MPEYLMTVKIPVTALDDAEARQKAKEFQNHHLKDIPENAEFKFQRVYKDRPPEGVSL